MAKTSRVLPTGASRESPWNRRRVDRVIWPPQMTSRVHVQRLKPQDLALATQVVRLLAEVFDEGHEPVGEPWIASVLGDSRTWRWLRLSKGK